MSWFENKPDNWNENLEFNNEQEQNVDMLETISSFFDDNFIEIEEFQNSFNSFSLEQKDFIQNSFNSLNENFPDELLNAVEASDWLPYDNKSFNVFEKQITELLQKLWIVSKLELEWKQEETKLNEENKKLNEEENKLNELVNIEKREKISALSSKIRESYSTVEIDGKMVDEIYQGLEGEWYEKDKKFIEKYWAKLLAYVQEHRSPEEFNSLYSDLKTAQEVYGLEIEWFDLLKTDIDSDTTPEPVENLIKEYAIDNSQYSITEVDWNILTYWNQKIDFWEKPPVKYITNGNFELKSWELNYKIDKQLRSEIFVLENSLENNKTLLENNSQALEQYRGFLENVNNATEFNQNSLNVLKQRAENENDATLKSQILEAIDNYEESPDQSSLDSLKDILSKKPSIKIVEAIELEAKVIEQEAQLARMKLQLETKQEQFRQQVLERDEVASSKLKILQNMTQGSVDQAPLEELFTEMNESSLQIDIWNGMIVSGFDLDTFEISGSGIPQWIHEDITNKKNDEIIARMMNVMFSGNPEQPIDLETIYTWMPVFKDESWEDISSTFSDNMRNKLWLDPRKYMRDNIEKYNSWTVMENNTEK